MQDFLLPVVTYLLHMHSKYLTQDSKKTTIATFLPWEWQTNLWLCLPKEPPWLCTLQLLLCCRAKKNPRTCGGLGTGHSAECYMRHLCSIQIPQYLHEAGWTANGYMVGITQPRRVAATTVCSLFISSSVVSLVPLLVIAGRIQSGRRERSCTGSWGTVTYT